MSVQPLRTAEITANPMCAAMELRLPSGEHVLFRPLRAEDATLLGEYFTSLTRETTRFYGPHAFDQATADQLCGSINYDDTIRFVALTRVDGREQIVAYFILVLGTSESDGKRYADVGIQLDPAQDCTFAPSVREQFQNQGLGTPLFRHVIHVARRLGRRKMVLMGGVQVLNTRGIHFYEKQGFRRVGGFEGPPGIFSQDMELDLLLDS